MIKNTILETLQTYQITFKILSELQEISTSNLVRIVMAQSTIKKKKKTEKTLVQRCECISRTPCVMLSNVVLHFTNSKLTYN